MATDIVQGLFGMTPESYQLDQQAAARQQAMQFANMNPFQRAAYGTFLGANQLGGAIGGALGAQDPMLQMIAKQQELLKTINPNDPKSLAQGAQAAAQFSPQLASALAKQANDLNASLSKQAQDLAAANKAAAEAGKIGTEQAALKANTDQLVTKFGMTEEQAKGIASNPDLLKAYLTPKSAQAFKLLESGKFTPESLVKWEKGEGQPELIDLAAKPGEDWLRVARGMGLPSNSSYNAYTPEQVAAVNKEVFNQDIQKRVAGAAVTRVDLGSALEKVYLSKDREESAKRWSEAGKAYEVTVPLLNQLDQVEKVLPNAFTGAFAEPKLALSKTLGAFGVNIGSRASDTEYINAISSKVVQQIARVFPGSLAVKELDQLVKSKFNVAQEAPTILRLLGQIRDEMKAQAVTFEQGSKLPDKDRTSFNTSLSIGQNMKQINRYRELENKYRSGNITDTERVEAKEIKQSLGL
jgi:hypothetical protein